MIIGCGNPARSDDGAAQAVLQRLRELRPELPPGVELIDAGTAGMEVMYRVRGAHKVVILDACTSNSDPGAVFRLPGSEAQTPPQHGFSLHGLRWDHALYAGSRLFGAGFADRTEVFLIEAASLEFGLALSPAVQTGVARAAEQIAALVDAWAADGRC